VCWTVGVWYPPEATDHIPLPNVQTSSGAHPVSYSVCATDYFLAPWSMPLLPSSAKFKSECDCTFSAHTYHHNVNHLHPPLFTILIKIIKYHEMWLLFCLWKSYQVSGNVVRCISASAKPFLGLCSLHDYIITFGNIASKFLHLFRHAESFTIKFWFVNRP